MKTTNPITYVYEIDGHRIEITRRHVGTAYAANGNVHNPTEYFLWDTRIDGEPGLSMRPTRADAYEHARAQALGLRYDNDDLRRRWVNVRSFRLVQDEMKANYRGRA